MESRPVELILAHNLSEHLAAPMLLLDAKGSLIFFNEPAEPIIGHRYEDVGEIDAKEWSEHLQAVDDTGEPVDPRTLKFIRALERHRPGHQSLRLRLQDGSVHVFEATAIPLTGRESRYIGAILVLWGEE